MQHISKMSHSISASFMQMATVNSSVTLTNKRMKSTFNELEKFAKANKWKDHKGNSANPFNLTQKQLTKYVAYRIDLGIAPRSLQNEMSHIRRSLIAAGRSEFANICTNKVLAVPKGTRIGKGKIVNPETYARAFSAAAPDTKLWMSAMYELGLRQRELVRSGASLRAWERQLMTGQPFIVLHDGAKGGKSRQIFIPPERVGIVLAIIRNLLTLAATRKGYVVDSINLEAACKQVGERFAALGLKGENCGHSLRRHYTQVIKNHFLECGYSNKDALAITSTYLGHGDGRGRWIHNNYLRPTEETGT